MTDTWFSMGQKVGDKKRNLLKPFQVNNKLLAIAKKKSIPSQKFTGIKNL